MKKLLYIIPSILLMLLTLTACFDTMAYEKDIHDFHLAYDEHSHYDLCECGKKENEEAHIFSDAIAVISEPTCTTEGIKEYTCIVCKYKEQRKTPALGHTYSDWEVVTAPTCISKGQSKRVCTVCGAEEFKDIDYATHTPTPYTDVTADCTHEGHVGGSYCSICKEELEPSTITQKTPHSFGEWETTITPDCTHIGQEVRVCQDCNHEEYREVAIKPHTSTPYTDLDASCTHEGHTGGTYCSVCNVELTPYTVIGKTAHTYDEWTTTQTPTCISEGQAKRECTSCGHEDYKYLDKTDHITTPGEAVASTCIEHGHTEGSYCSFCHKELEEPQELPLGSHNYSIETTTKNSTLNSEGELTHTCSVCGDSYTTPIDRKLLTQMIWIKSFKEEDFNNHFVEYYYVDKTSNKTYDILVENYNGIKHVRILDHATSKYYEYYYDGHEIIESCADGYRHKAFVDMPDTDMYLEWYSLVLYNAVYFASFAYDKVEFQADNGGYFIANGIEVKNYKGNTETATVAVSFNDDEKLTGFNYSSEKYDICILEIGNSSSIVIPTATHHHIVDGKCEICNEQYYTYTTTKDNLNLSYYVNKNNKSVEFDYSLKYSNQSDVTFLYPTYYEDGNIKRFTTLYYEGSSNYSSKQVKSYTINSNKLLKITYKDYSAERLLLLNDGTAIIASSDSDYANNPYNGNPVGQTFDLIQADKTIRYYIKSDTEIVITEYKEINYYIVGDKEFTNFNSRTIDKVFGKTFMSDNKNGVKPDGSHDFICFVLSSDLNLEISYTYLNNPAFSVVTFQRIEGYLNQGGKEFYIYFMADNKNYVLHYNTTNIEISKS